MLTIVNRRKLLIDLQPNASRLSLTDRAIRIGRNLIKIAFYIFLHIIRTYKVNV